LEKVIPLLDLSVIIVTYNHEHEIKKCLASLGANLGNLIVEIIIIDNHSLDRTVRIVIKSLTKFPRSHNFSIIVNETNKGFTKAVNQGLTASNGKYLLILNPDIEFHADVVTPLVEFMKQDKQIGIVTPQFLNADGTIQPSCRRFPRHRDFFYNLLGLNLLFKKSKEFNYWKMGDFNHQSKKEVEQPQGAFLLTHRRVVNQVGFLDEQFPMFFSDVDWCRRLIQNQWKILYVPGVKIIHHKGTSIYRHRLKMIWSSHRSMYHYFKKYSKDILGSFMNYLTGEFLLLAAVLRSIFYQLNSNKIKDY